MRVSVPGKLLLAGEYAVLLPAEACVVAAVERRLFVEAQPAARWSAESAGVRWSEGDAVPPELKFVVGAIDAVRARWSVAPRHLVTSDELRAGGHKLGLGGSAAATVAATFAAAEGSGANREELWAVADAVHRAQQGGKGSGADVAASVFGGVLRYLREPRSAARLPVHPDVRLVLVWTGASVQTQPRLERWHAFVRERPEQVRLFAEVSRGAVGALAPALEKGDSAAIRGALAQARAALKGLEEQLGLELETEALRRAAEVAWQAGAAGKLSGAGGGDCAVVVAVGDEAQARVVRALGEAGLEAFPVDVAGEGVRVEG